jgi:hypothetical protein
MKLKGSVETGAGWVSVFETRRVRFSGAFLLPDLVFSFFSFFLADLWRVSKTWKKIQPGFKVLVLKQFISASSQTWFLDHGFQNFCFSKNKIKILQKIKSKVHFEFSFPKNI